MLRPVEMSLLTISIHKSKIPLLLNEIPKFPYFQVRDLKETSVKKRRTHYGVSKDEIFSEEKELLQHKIHEIEENLIYILSELDIDPDKEEKPTDPEKYSLEVENVEELIDRLHEETENEKRRLRGFSNDIVRYTEELSYNHMLEKTLQWLKQYHIRKPYVEWTEQLQYHLYYASPSDFHSFEVALDHYNIPRVLQYDKISPKEIVFFLIFHQSHENEIDDMIRAANAREIEDLEEFLDDKGVMLEEIESQIKFCNERIERAKNLIVEMKSNHLKYRAFLEILENARNFLHMEEQFFSASRNQIVQLEAFVPTKDQVWISAQLIKMFQNSIKILAKTIERDDDEESEHESASEDDSTKMKVPSLVVPSKIFKPFKLLVDLYGTANYNELDPTPIVAFTFSFLFGLMFGDVGHGFVLIVFGLVLIFLKRKDKSNSIYDFGFIMLWLGAAASFAGLLYGEIFGNPLIINGHHIILFANPMENIIDVFKLAILVGVVHLNIGWFLSMINFILKKRTYLAFGEPFFKIILLSCGTYLIFNWGFDISAWLSPPYPILLASLPALGILLAKPLGKSVFKISYLQEESLGSLLGEASVEVGETYLSILSNVASYSRLLALSMAHMGLMLIVSTLVETLGQYEWLVPIILIFGNLFVIVMEGVIAAIHSLRLQFYEFFGKFYTANGIAYQNTKIANDYSKVVFINLE